MRHQTIRPRVKCLELAIAITALFVISIKSEAQTLTPDSQLCGRLASMLDLSEFRLLREANNVYTIRCKNGAGAVIRESKTEPSSYKVVSVASSKNGGQKPRGKLLKAVFQESLNWRPGSDTLVSIDPSNSSVRFSAWPRKPDSDRWFDVAWTNGVVKLVKRSLPFPPPR